MSKLINDIVRTISENDIKVVSFDLFDTLLYRRVAKPTAVFGLACQHAGSLTPITLADSEYEELRHVAEKKIRQQHTHGEVTLTDIFKGMPLSPAQKSALMAAELQIESEVAFLDEKLTSIIETLIAQNVKVVFISDMYLLAEQVRETFFPAGSFLHQIPMFMSCEYKASKASGSLFHAVKEALEIEYASWLHVGDNLLSDIKNAERLGIKAVWVAPAIDHKMITLAEEKCFSAIPDCNAIRMLSCVHRPSDCVDDAFELGAFSWGALLLAFCDWVIDKTIAHKSGIILCIMREGEVFTPLINTRLEQRGIRGIDVKKFYVSRKSTLLPSIDLLSEHWMHDMLALFMKIRGYCIANLYRDLSLPVDALHQNYENLELRKADCMFHQGENVLTVLSKTLSRHQETIRNIVLQAKAAFHHYFEQNIGYDYNDCVVVDLGAGGTAQHQVECALDLNARANLLLLSNHRIYENLSTAYESFIGAHNDNYQIRQLFSRSPECIEGFLLGDVGTTTGYDEFGQPVLGPSINANHKLVSAFFEGVKSFFDCFDKYGFTSLDERYVVSSLARYVRMPTEKESRIFTALLHEDNFGADNVYPVISDREVELVRQQGCEQVISNLEQYDRWNKWLINWPQAIISLLDPTFLFRRQGLVFNDNNQNIERLIAMLKERRWPEFTVCGGGIFFEQFYQAASAQALKVERIVDRKAEINGQYELCGLEVLSLKQALQSGSRKFAITSFAFKDEIAKNIISLARDMGIELQVEIVSV